MIYDRYNPSEVMNYHSLASTVYILSKTENVPYRVYDCRANKFKDCFNKQEALDCLNSLDSFRDGPKFTEIIAI